MAIKFGDLIENINADQAVIDLLNNNAKGVLYVNNFLVEEVAAIPEEKRGVGTVLVVKSTGSVYVFTGSEITEQYPGAVSSGYFEDLTDSTNWVEVGQVPIRETDLYANISSGPDPSQADQKVDEAYTSVNLTNLNKLRKFVYEMYQNPPESFGQFKAGDLVVAAGDDENALEIIVKALSATQPYDLQITGVTGTLKFGQTSGTISLAGSVTAINYNLLNEDGNNTTPQEYKWYYRQINTVDWEEVDSGWNTIDQNAIDDAADTITLNDSHEFTVGDITGDQFDFPGFEYQLELRDNSDGTGNVTGSQSAFVEGTPVVKIATGETITPTAYVSPTASISIAQSGSAETTTMYDPDALRTKGNMASIVTFSWEPSDQNADGGPNTTLAITDTKVVLKKAINGPTFASADVPSNGFSLAGGNPNPVGSGTYTTAQSAQCTFSNAQIQSLNPGTLDAFQFELYYQDDSLDDWALAASSPVVELRFPIFAGFSTATAASVPLALGEENSIPADLTAEVVEGLEVELGGWSGSATDLSDPAYQGEGFNSAKFPLLDPGMGRNQSDDDDYGGTSVTAQADGRYSRPSAAVPPVYGWYHNAEGIDLGDPYPATEGIGADGTRFFMAFPNTGYSFGTQNTLGVSASPSFLIDLTINGITREYRVAGSQFVSSHNSEIKKQLVASTPV